MAVPEAVAPTQALIGLGSNLDDPESQIHQAFKALAAIADTRLVRRSRLFRSAPWGMTEQPAFVNAVAELSTRLGPWDLLGALQNVEREQGRRRDGPRWGPRTLDLDLLWWGETRMAEVGLTLPHPHIAERAFVLLPLADLDTGMQVPGLGPVRELLAHVDARGCEPLDEAV